MFHLKMHRHSLVTITLLYQQRSMYLKYNDNLPIKSNVRYLTRDRVTANVWSCALTFECHIETKAILQCTNLFTSQLIVYIISQVTCWNDNMKFIWKSVNCESHLKDHFTELMSSIMSNLVSIRLDSAIHFFSSWQHQCTLPCNI